MITFKHNVENIEHLDQLKYHTTHVGGLDGYIKLNINRLDVMTQQAYWKESKHSTLAILKSIYQEQQAQVNTVTVDLGIEPVFTHDVDINPNM